MGKAAYIGVGNIARKVKKMYIGANGVARKVKKAYIGVGGVARLLFSGGDFRYYGKLADAPNAGQYWAAVNAINYAIFAGPSYSNYKMVTYDTSLTQGIMATNLGAEANDRCSLSFKGLAMLAGGKLAMDYTSAVDGYDRYLVKYPGIPALNQQAGGVRSTVWGGSYALFGGGSTYGYSGDPTAASNVTTYDEAYTKISTPSLTGRRRSHNGASSNTGAFFAGGFFMDSSGGGGSQTLIVDGYNLDITKIAAVPNLPIPMSNQAAASFNGFAVFIGGQGNAAQNSLVLYDDTATMTRILKPGSAKFNSTALVLEDFLIDGPGNISSSFTETANRNIDVYDLSFTLINTLTYPESAAPATGTYLKHYAVYMGGYNDSSGVAAFTKSAYAYKLD